MRFFYSCMEQLTIALVQAPLVWENPEANRLYFSKEIAKISVQTDLFLLPEMFTSGFTMQPENIAEPLYGETFRWMRETARERDSALAGSIVVAEEGVFYNRFVFVTAQEIFYYDKRHLFSLAGEPSSFAAGAERTQFSYKGFEICPMVCYDLRFPAFSRNTTNYDLLLYVANWPVQRIGAWNALIKARAIENMAYVAGVNRVGQDPSGSLYNGQSQLLDVMGEEIIPPFEHAGTRLATIYKEPLLKARRKFGFLDDRDIVTVT